MDQPAPYQQTDTFKYSNTSTLDEVVATLRFVAFLFIGLFRRTVQRKYWNILLVLPFLISPIIGIAVIVADTFFSDYVQEKLTNFKRIIKTP